MTRPAPVLAPDGLPARIDALVFDCGDTLLELVPAKEAVLRDVLAELGLDVPLALVRRAYDIVEGAQKQQSSKETTRAAKAAFMSRFNAGLCDALGLRTWAGAVDQRLQQAIPARCRWTADEATRQWLAWASARHPCFVLANWDRNLPAVLERAGIAHFFKGAYCSELLGAEKPAPACFAAFLEAAGLQGPGLVYVGNEYVADVAGSRAAGFAPVLLDRHGRYPDAADCPRVTSWEGLRMKLQDR